MNLKLTLPLLLLVAACGAKDPEAAPEGPGAAPIGGPADAAAPAGATDRGPMQGGAQPLTLGGSPPPDATVQADKSNAELYAECKERVEGREVDGECTTDEDCVAAGCSTEVCMTKANAEGFTTTCDAQPCFEALDTCGCVEGRCSWSVKPDAPATDAPPAGDPPAGDAPAGDAPAGDATDAPPAPSNDSK